MFPKHIEVLLPSYSVISLKFTIQLNNADSEITNRSGVGDPSFSFKYADGEYLINKNDFVYNIIANNGNGAVVGCRCAFPVAGEPKKLKRDFIA